MKQCKGLGFLASNQKGVKTVGLKLHSSFVVDTQGLPLGVLHAKGYAPDPSKVVKKKSAKRNTPISKKESCRWLEQYQVCVNASKDMPDINIVNVMPITSIRRQIKQLIWNRSRQINSIYIRT